MTAITAITTLTKVTTLSIGNKKGKVYTAHIGDGSKTLETSGIPLVPTQLGMKHFDYLVFDGGSLQYEYDYDNQVILGYTASSAAAAAVTFVLADQSTPHETIRILAIGY